MVREGGSDQAVEVDCRPGALAGPPIAPKWMSDDGRACWMVFSGSDNFCVRRTVFQTAS